MKPLKLIMSAFGSYARIETVDFEKAGNGIFLITGDTGSGKTTIFDAVSYALYGETSGGVRDGSMMRSQYAQEDAETYVDLTFQVRGKTYQVIRSPQYSRISKRKNKEGTYSIVPVAGKVRLILEDGSEYPGRMKDINDKIQEIMGVDQNQFSQIAMIAQGEYVKLLHASSKERKDIFSRIFNTGIYRKIQMDLRMQDKQLTEQLGDNGMLYRHELERFVCIENSSYAEELEELKQHPETATEEIRHLTEEILEEARQWEEKRKQQSAEKQEEWKKEEERGRIAKENNELLKRYMLLQEKLKELQEQEELWQQKRESLQMGKNAEKIRPLEKRYQEWKQEYEQAVGLKQNLKKEQEQIVGWLQQKKEYFQEQQKKWEKQQPVLSEEITRLTDVLPLYREYEQKSERNHQNREELEQLQKMTEQMELKQKQRKELLQKSYQEREKLEDCAVREAKLRQEITDLKEQQKMQERLERERQEYVKCYEKWSDNYKSMKICREKYNQEEQRYESRYRAFIAMQAGILAEELQEGQACPVCGSTCHPAKAVLAAEHVTEQQVNEAKERKEQVDRILRKAAEEVRGAKEKCETVKQHLKEAMVQSFGEDMDLRELEEKIREYLKELKKQEKEKELLWRQAEEEMLTLKKVKEFVSQTEQTIVDEEQLLKEKLERYQQLLLSVQEVKVQLDQILERLPYEQKEEAQKRKKHLEKIRNQLNQETEQARIDLESIQKRHTENEARQKEIQRKAIEYQEKERVSLKEYRETIQREGFASEEAYHQSGKTRQELQDLEKQIAVYEKEKLQTETRTKELAQQTEQIQWTDLEGIRERIAVLAKDAAELQKAYLQAAQIRSNNETAEAAMHKLLKQRGELENEYRVIHRLSQTANGKLGGQAGLDFQTFVQRRYFKQMVQAANKRLQFMNDGKFLLRCREIEDLGRQGEVGLDLDVYSMVTDKVRDVKTLSGGESFMAALAMALGMADVIQNTAGRVRIDTMFIDEGFGSLDEESRIRAIRILQKLADGHRMIGIISHVTELKEQMDRKLVVEKGRQGSRIRWDIEI